MMHIQVRKVTFVIIAMLSMMPVSQAVHAQSSWFKYPGNPVLQPGPPGAWDESILDLAVIKEDGKYKMWYTGWEKSMSGFSNFGYATSHDGMRWNKYESNPLAITCNSDPWDDFYYTFDLLKQGSTYKIWFTASANHSSPGIDPSDSGFSFGIGYAWSEDGLHWEKLSYPVLLPGKDGEWDEKGIGDPTVIFDGEKYHMWYNGIPDRMPKMVMAGYATSNDGIHWTKHPSNPVFDVGEPGSFEDRWVAINEVVMNGPTFEMWYFGYDYIKFQGGYATSEDGINWQRYPQNPVLPTGMMGTWESSMVTMPAVLVEDSVYRLWYYANNNIDEGIGYATTSMEEKARWDEQGLPSFYKEVRVYLFNHTEVIPLDSLHAALPALSVPDEIDAYNMLALAYSLNNESLSYYYAGKALKLAQKYNYRKGMAYALYSKGNSQYVRNDYVHALTNQLSALYLFDSLGMEHEAATLLSQIANIHYYTGSYRMAIRYHQRALEKYERQGDFGSMMQSLDDLGEVFLRSGDTIEAIRYYKELLSLSIVHNEEAMVGTAYQELGRCHRIYSLDSSLYYLNQALNIWKDKDFVRLGMASLQIGEAYFSEGPEYYDAAEKYYLISYHHFQHTLGGEINQLRLIKNLAELYLQKGSLDKAYDYLNRSVELATMFLNKHDHQMYSSLNEKLEHEIFLNSSLAEIYHLYYRYDTTLQDIKSAHKHFILATAWRDSVQNDLVWRQTAMVQGQFETENARNQIFLLERENRISAMKVQQTRMYLFILGGLILLLVVFAFILLRQNKIRAENRLVLLEHKLLRSQMNPHFIFNALANIQDFIWNKDPLTANEYLTSFSKLVRWTLDNLRNDFIPLEKEIIALENYLSLQKLRFRDKFDYKIEIDQSIDTETMVIPPMLMQPYIENSIEHGLKSKSGKGNILIRVKLADDLVQFEIIDDGIGFRGSAEKKNNNTLDHRSLAMNINKERLFMLYKNHKKKIDVSASDEYDENGMVKGARVVIKIPYL